MNLPLSVYSLGGRVTLVDLVHSSDTPDRKATTTLPTSMRNRSAILRASSNLAFDVTSRLSVENRSRKCRKRYSSPTKLSWV
uniref:Uncharacterized protein n=1 Tax=Vespula pensylvanica TaxID=30213 RepID=A0A834NYJ8_VESPE|nr:hypothetical protein H0235_009326 [Vespula pensylvanica]